MPKYSRGQFAKYANRLDIDYHSLYLFWCRSNETQRMLMSTDSFYFAAPPDETNSAPLHIQRMPNFKGAVYKICHKMTPKQREVIKSGLFKTIQKNKLSKRARKRIFGKLQFELELGLIESPEEFNIDEAPPLAARSRNGFKRFQVWYKDSIQEYDACNVPPTVEAWSMWKLVQRQQNARCFFTGEECIISRMPADWRVTEEHLFPSGRGGKRTNNNTVVAASWINNRLGAAPIQVKIKVKAALDKLAFHPTITNRAEKQVLYSQLVDNVLESYMIGGLFPWNTPPKKHTALRKKLAARYKELKQDEEKILDLILTRSSNISRIIKEVANGLESTN